MADHDSGALSREVALTQFFYDWELRGRGWWVWDDPVALEPPFRPFVPAQWTTVPAPVLDDGRRSTFLSRLASTFRAPESEAVLVPDEQAEPVPDLFAPTGPFIEYAISLPADTTISREAAERLLVGLSLTRAPLAFEIVGSAGAIEVGFACQEDDESLLRKTLFGLFPDAHLGPRQLPLLGAAKDEPEHVLCVEFGLADEFMLPIETIGSFSMDPLIEVCAALGDLDPSHHCALQVLFQGVANPWAREMLRSVSDGRGGSFFADAPEITAGAKEKCATPLVSAVVRIACVADSRDERLALARALTASFRQFAKPGSNELIPLENTEYPDATHVEDLLARATHRSGMILSTRELASLVHLPSRSVLEEGLARAPRRTRRLPELARGHPLVLGTNVHRGRAMPVTLNNDQRSRHVYMIGASGTGKSTLLLSMICQDIERGAGLAVLDPHGDLIEDVLARVPEERAQDVILFDPSDEAYPVPFNILHAGSETEKNLLVSDLGAVFRRLSTSWGDQMTTVLGNAISAFLERPEGGTLLDLRHFLSDAAFRKKVLSTVDDPEIVYFWEHEFSHLSGRPQSSILTRLNTFLRPKIIRYLVAQKESRIDFTDMMETGKIFLAKLSGGLIGEENSHLLGSLLISRFYQLAIARQQLSQEARRDFWLYVDEFHNFVTPSMASILSAARKYRLGMVLAHQDMAQISGASDVASAALANAYTRICFRLGDADAAKLAGGFSSFDSHDLQSLGIGEAIARIEQSANDFTMSTAPLEAVDEALATARREAIVRQSRARYATRREVVREALGEVHRDAAPLKREEKATGARRPSVDLAKAPVAPPIVGKKPKAQAPEVPLPGRGGSEHTYLQTIVAKAGQNRGYRAMLEKAILDGAGRVDVALVRGEFSIACEISVTSTVEQEAAHARNALRAGFDEAVVIAGDEKRVRRIQGKVTALLDDVERERFLVLSPPDFIAHLDDLLAREQGPEERTVRGYRVKVGHEHTGQTESKARGAVAKVIAESLKRMKGEK